MHRRAFLAGAAALAAAPLGPSPASAGPDYDAWAARLRVPPAPEGGLSEMIRLAALAPNGHNTQPWRFALTADEIRLAPDPARRTPVVDPDDHHVFVSLGAAAQALALAGEAAGRPGALEVAPSGQIRFAWTSAAPADSPRVQALLRRRSTRSDFDGARLAPAALAALETAGRVPGTRLILFDDARRMGAARDLIVAGNSAQMDDPAFVDELKSWLRFNAGQAMATGDGLYTAASGNPTLPGWLGPLAFSLFFSKGSENDKYARQIETSSGLAVFLAEQEGPRGWVQVGRAAMAFLLEAELQGLKAAFVNQPVEVAALRAELAALVGEPGLRPDLLIRFGRAPGLPFSPRRPPQAVIDEG